jgi:hypothetical protein
MIKPAIEDLKEEFPSVRWVSVNTHNDPEEYATSYQVKVVPTIVMVTLDESGNPILTEKQSGTNIINYYRIIRNSIRQLSS